MIHEEEGKSCANRARKLPNTARARAREYFRTIRTRGENRETPRRRDIVRAIFSATLILQLVIISVIFPRHAIFFGVTVKYRCSFAARGRDDLIIYLMNLYYLLFSASAREFDQIRENRKRRGESRYRYFHCRARDHESSISLIARSDPVSSLAVIIASSARVMDGCWNAHWQRRIISSPRRCLTLISSSMRSF